MKAYCDICQKQQEIDIGTDGDGDICCQVCHVILLTFENQVKIEEVKQDENRPI